MTSRSSDRASPPKDSGERGPGTPPPLEKAIRSDHSPDLAHVATGGAPDYGADQPVMLALRSGSPGTGTTGADAKADSHNTNAEEPLHSDGVIARSKGQRSAPGAAAAWPFSAPDVQVGLSPFCSPFGQVHSPGILVVLTASLLGTSYVTGRTESDATVF